MSNSSVFKLRLKVLRSSADLQLYDSEFQAEGALTQPNFRGFEFRYDVQLIESG